MSQFGAYSKSVNGPVDFWVNGVPKVVTDVISITNRGNAVDMDGTGEGLLFRQYYYDAVTPAVFNSGRISAVCEGDATSVLGTQDTTLAFATTLNGVLSDKMALTSNGYLGINTTAPYSYLHVNYDSAPATTEGVSQIKISRDGGGDSPGDIGGQIQWVQRWQNAAGSIRTGAIRSVKTSGSGIYGGGLELLYQSAADVPMSVGMTMNNVGAIGLGTASNAQSAFLDLEHAGTVKANTDFFEITNTVNAADMDGTGTSIVWGQMAYDAATPTRYTSGRIGIFTEQDWTVATATTRDSYMSLQTSLDGTVSEKVRITSAGDVGIGVTPTAALDILRNETGYHEELYVRQTTDPGEGSIGLGVSTSVSSILFRAYGSGSPGILASACAFLGATGNQMVVGTGNAMPMYFYTNDSFATPNMKLSTTGRLGIGTGTDDALTTSMLELRKAGTAKANTDILIITNSVNAVDMDTTSSGLAFYQYYYDAATPAPSISGRIAYETETDWTVLASSRNSSYNVYTTRENVIGKKMTITSVGGTVYVPTAVQNIVAATGITAAMLARNIKIQSSTAGNLDITANPQIVAGTDGQIICFIGQDNTKTVQFDTGTGLTLAGGAACTLGLGDTLELVYDSGLALWCEISRSNNA